MDLHSISRAVCWALSDCRAQDSLGLPALRLPGGREERREGRGGGDRGGGDRGGGRTGRGQSDWTPGPPENGDAAAALDAQPSLQQQLRCHLPLPSPSTGGHCASSRHRGLLPRGLSGLAPSALARPRRSAPAVVYPQTTLCPSRTQTFQGRASEGLASHPRTVHCDTLLLGRALGPGHLGGHLCAPSTGASRLCSGGEGPPSLRNPSTGAVGAAGTQKTLKGGTVSAWPLARAVWGNAESAMNQHSCPAQLRPSVNF